MISEKTPSDFGLFRVGERVWFRGRHADRFTVRGVIEKVTPKTGHEVIYGVRLENGNYVIAEPNQVRERGNVEGSPVICWACEGAAEAESLYDAESGVGMERLRDCQFHQHDE